MTGVSQTAYHLSKEVALAGSSAVQISVANALVAINPTLETIGWDLPPAGLQDCSRCRLAVTRCSGQMSCGLPSRSGRTTPGNMC